VSRLYGTWMPLHSQNTINIVQIVMGGSILKWSHIHGIVALRNNRSTGQDDLCLSLQAAPLHHARRISQFIRAIRVHLSFDYPNLSVFGTGGRRFKSARPDYY